METSQDNVFLTLSPNGSLDKRRKETRKRGNQERASAMIVDTYVHSIQVKAENQRSKDSRTEVTISISGVEASLLRLKPTAKLRHLRQSLENGRSKIESRRRELKRWFEASLIDLPENFIYSSIISRDPHLNMLSKQ